MTSPLPVAPHQLYAYEPPVSLWELIKSYVPEHELQEVKDILGESLVEQSIELHQEVDTLLEIWRDYRHQTENNLMYHRLPEPPAARERLVQEIKFFVDNLREKSGDMGTFASILSKHNKSVLDYVLDSKRPPSASHSRPTSARSPKDGRETPVTVTTPDRLSHVCTLSEKVDSLKNNLNFLQLDEVVHHLRHTLMEEVQWLLKDTEFLQKCLEEESEMRANPMMSREPSLADLREERSKLEKDLLADDIPRGLKNIDLTGCRSSVLSVAGRKTATPPGTPHEKLGPLKASHQICTQTAGKQCTSELCDKHRANACTVHKTPALGTVQSHETDDSGRNSASPQSRSLPEGDQVRLRSGSNPTQGLLSDTPSHVAVRTGLPPKPKLINTGSVPIKHSGITLHTPTPPTSSKPKSARPGSAQRFRQMVLECREGN